MERKPHVPVFLGSFTSNSCPSVLGFCRYLNPDQVEESGTPAQKESLQRGRLERLPSIDLIH